MGSIAYDSQTGVLVKGIVWEFAGGPDLEKAMEKDHVYGNWMGDENSRDRHDCPVSKTHKTGTTVLEVSIELFGGEDMDDFLPLVNHGFVIISRAFAERLNLSGLSGFVARKGVTIVQNQSGAKD